MRVLFLDIDGVLTVHNFDRKAQSNYILPAKVDILNRVLDETGCIIVLSSAWRYQVLGGAMTLRGFDYLLRSHRVRVGRLVGVTDKDPIPLDPPDQYKGRARVIQKWVDEHPVEAFAVVDDGKVGFEGLPIVSTDGQVGITEADADRLIEILGREDAQA